MRWRCCRDELSSRSATERQAERREVVRIRRETHDASSTALLVLRSYIAAISEPSFRTVFQLRAVPRAPGAVSVRLLVRAQRPLPTVHTTHAPPHPTLPV